MSKIGVIGIPGGWSTDLLGEEVEKKTGFKLIIDMEYVTLDLNSGKMFYQEHDLTEIDALIIKKIGPRYSPDLLDRLDILRYLSEKKGIRIFSNPFSIMRLLDRLSCTVTLRANDIPMPPTVITENINSAVQAAKDFGKAVFKPLYSTKARGMKILNESDDILAEVKKYREEGNRFFYIQQMVNHSGQDLGVAFLGGKYLATYARVGNKDSWNTTARSGGYYQSYEPSEEILEIAYKAQSLFNLDFTSVDIVETDEGPKVFEVSAFGGFRGLKDANNINAAELYVKHVLENI